MKVKKNRLCRICKGKKLKVFLDLGKVPLANSFLTKSALARKEPKYPLAVAFCSDCNLCQLTHVVDPETLFRKYVYFSSGMPVLPEHFKNYASEVASKFINSENDLVVEIGSNDGILLSAIKDQGARVLGVDPAKNIAKVANQSGIKTIADFFSDKLAKNIVKRYGKTKVIIGNNVVAHIDNHRDLVKGVYTILDDDGVFIFEAPYLVDMFKNLTFDTIYHEHLSYLAIRPLKKLFEQHNMEIIDVKTFPVQGVSLRVYAAKKGRYPVASSVSKFIGREIRLKMHRYSSYAKLAARIKKMRQEVLRLLKKIKARGRRVAAYGAPAKGNTLLNFYGVGRDILDYATEGLPSKIGLYTPGTHIPVVDIEVARKDPPDYYLLLAWNYKDAVLEKEKEFRKNGGKFVLPVGKIGVI